MVQQKTSAPHTKHNYTVYSANGKKLRTVNTNRPLRAAEVAAEEGPEGHRMLTVQRAGTTFGRVYAVRREAGYQAVVGQTDKRAVIANGKLSKPMSLAEFAKERKKSAPRSARKSPRKSGNKASATVTSCTNVKCRKDEACHQHGKSIRCRKLKSFKHFKQF